MPEAVLHATCEVTKSKPEKNSGFSERDSNPWPSIVLYQLSYQAKWQPVILWIRNIPIEMESEIYEIHTFELRVREWISESNATILTWEPVHWLAQQCGAALLQLFSGSFPSGLQILSSHTKKVDLQAISEFLHT